ncbi:TIGR02391 family protein [Xanthomonas sp. GW]|uniref:TIGR02391 family protein n=1 Tax=Xanthomonas sp. GW TaxID=2724121 RepID=UPI001639B756|nr:TIGR02391 family protein [Xanthomonas sp. GW]
MSEMLQTSNNPDIQYHGSANTTQSCLKAIIRLVEAGGVRLARILTCTNRHAFYLEFSDPSPACIKSGFASGYSGEGSAGLALAIRLLQRHRIDVEECDVSFGLMARLDRCSLTHSDIEAIRESTLRRPTRVYDYANDGMAGRGKWEDALRSRQPMVIPWAILDGRLIELALDMESDPDMAVFRAFRDLEEIVKQRCSLAIELHGLSVFKRAFRGGGSILEWRGMHQAEADGRAQLFEGAYSAFRNARAHRGGNHDLRNALREFLVANELFLLEAEAVPRASVDRGPV